MMTPRQIFFRHLGLPSQKPLAIEISRSEGIYLFDPDGKRYIDLVSGVSVSNLGHGNPEVLEAVRKQTDRYMHLMVYGELIQAPQVSLARELALTLPENLNCTYFVSSGSEAIEGALKLARKYTRRIEIAAFKKAYHGGTFGALSILGDEKLKNPFRPLLPGIRQLGFNSFDDLGQITRQTACVVVESIQAEAGIILPEEGFLNALRARCTETGTLFILDDIQMGMGRTGRLFSFENYGFTPDILVLAKAFGGGMPLGAFISSKEIMGSLAYDPELGHITTFGGHPVSCAAALASLQIIKRDRLYSNAEQKGKMFCKRLEGHPLIASIRQKGLMLGLDLPGPEQARALSRIMLDNGLITDLFLFRPNAFRIAPPLTISTEEIQEAGDLIVRSLDQI